MSRDDVPEIVQGWVHQLLDPEFLALVEHIPSDHSIDVRLYANRGKVARRPAIAVDAGPLDLIPPA